MTQRSPRIVIVGAGLGGLSAACHLLGRGFTDIEVLEAADEPGGRAGTLASAGYRFDTGPTVLTMPHLVAECFAAIGARMADHLVLRPVDPMYRAHFADDSVLHVRHGRDAMREEIERVCGPSEAAAFERFCGWLQRLYELEMPRFVERNYDSPLDLIRPLGPAVELVRLSAFRRLAATVARYFQDERLRRIFSFQALYAGLAPHEALSIYALIAYMDAINGVVVPVGGMHALPRALADAAAAAGVRFRYKCRAERILLEHGSTGAVRGVRLEDGDVVPADVVVANPDLPLVYRTLLAGARPPRVVRRGTYSPSAVVWHVGTRGALPPGTEHHNIHFGSAWETAFRDLLHGGTRMRDPSLLVSVPSLHEPSMAPAGGHVLFALEPVPNLDGRLDWTRERDHARDALADRLARLGYPVAPTDVDVERLVDPLDWEAQGMERGTPFALAHRFRQTGPFRPGNVDRRFPGLVLCGSGTVPGVGIPMVLVSGKLAAARVAEREGRS